MSDQDPKSASGGEPSMEDILASIRRILAEDGSGAPATEESPSAQSVTARASVDPKLMQAPMQEPAATVVSEMRRRNSSKSHPFDDDAFRDSYGRDEDGEDVFVLTPEMRIEVSAGLIGGERVVSSRTAASGTDVLAQLASAILDRRDIAVTARDITLEGMVREMLRPLLREWLDRNLPYLIERLVKREIDLMINRAERLED